MRLDLLERVHINRANLLWVDRRRDRNRMLIIGVIMKRS